ncbi:MAG: ribosome-associated translation inhibitor RaiA [Acidobacteriota bacterium]|jgi:putative sigma-54 modulation protein|nr:ribosome-associated translation inhibitor RaiA [Acidobacteriota bacterium]
MKVDITGRHIEVTPAIRGYIQKKLAKLGKLLGDDISFHVIIDVAKDRQKAEILLKSRLLELTGKGQSDDLYNSIIQAVEKLERQALKQKGRLIEGKRSKAKEKSVATRTGSGGAAAKTPSGKSARVRKEALRKKPMTVEEASAALEGSDASFVAFRNADGGDMSVLYRHGDGSVRLIRG